MEHGRGMEGAAAPLLTGGGIVAYFTISNVLSKYLFHILNSI